MISIDPKSKCEREEIKTFMKSLWDAYKTIIEIVRTNNKLEAGQGFVEYAIILILVGIAVVLVVSLM